AAASRPASGRSCLSPRSDSHCPQANRIPREWGADLPPVWVGSQTRVRAADSEWGAHTWLQAERLEERPGSDVETSEPGIFAESVSISSTRPAGCFGFRLLHRVDRA